MATTISYGKNIEHSIEDTFELEVSCDTLFEDGDKLKFEISENEDVEPIISKTFSLNEERNFVITLTTAEQQLLTLKNYIYRMIITSATSKTTTRHSGTFKMKWGA